MKNKFLFYFIGWLAVLALFNLIVFITPEEINGASKYTTMFWVAYGFVTVEFIIQLISSAFVFSEKSSKKVIYSIPLYLVSYITLILMLIVGTVCVAVIDIPSWLGIIGCSVVLVIHVLAIVSASILRGSIASTDERIKQNTMFIKMLTVEAQALSGFTSDAQMKQYINTVYESFRYSDPMSNPMLQQLESNIMSKFTMFSNCVKANDIVNAQVNSNELLALINERNMKCKLLK